jgi:hypothetical protein
MGMSLAHVFREKSFVSFSLCIHLLPRSFLLVFGFWALFFFSFIPEQAHALTVSGTLYSDEGVTALTGSRSIKLAVGTSTPAAVYTTTSSAGAWSFTVGGTLTPSTPIVIWVDATTSIRAALFTKASTTSGNITGLSLYQNRVIVSHEATTSTSTIVANLAFYDNSNDSDIQYSATSSTGEFTVFNGQELHVMSGKILELSGSTTITGDLHIATSSRFIGGATTTIVGNFTNQGAFTENGASKWIFGSVSEAHTWQTVTYGNGIFVALSDGCGTGRGYCVMTSPDGVTWTARFAAGGNGNEWESVTYGNGLFVAVAETGTGNRVMTSPDGFAWTSRNAATDNDWQSVTYGNGTFVAVSDTGTNNRVMTSPDGITWTSQTSAANNAWESVTYGNGLFVAVACSIGLDGTCNATAGNRVMTSPDGITWTSQTSAANNSWISVTYGNGIFVAVSFDGGSSQVMTSPNGTLWTLRATPSSANENDWWSVTYGNAMFVAVSETGTNNRVMTSLDGITWKTQDTSTVAGVWGAVTYGNGKFVAVAYDSGTVNSVMVADAHLFISSTTAQTLQGVMTGTSTLTDVTFVGAGTKTFANNASTTNMTISAGATVVAPAQLGIDGTFSNSGTFTHNAGTLFMSDSAVASGTLTGTSLLNNISVVGTGTVKFTSSASSTNLTIGTAATLIAPDRLTVGGDFTNNGIYSSGMNEKWGSGIGTTDVWWNSIAYGNGKFVAVGDHDVNPQRAMVSTDGVTWSPNNAIDDSWVDIAYGNGTFVAVSNSNPGGVMTSTDGVNWSSRSSALTGTLDAVTYGNGTFVALGWCSGCDQVMTSPNGVNWTARSIPSNESWRDVTYGNGTFVAVGYGGVVMTSTNNGATWTDQSSASASCGGTCDWDSITYGNGTFVALRSTVDGWYGSVATSPDGVIWTTQYGSDDITQWTDVTYNNDLFVAIGQPTYLGQTAVMTSPDGISWSPKISPINCYWNGVAYGGGVFAAVGDYCPVSGSWASYSKSLVTFSSTTAQTISGTLTATSSLGDVAFSGAGTKTFANNASTTNFTINSGATVVAPSLLSISSNYTNSGTFTAGTGTTTFNGDSLQTATGTMTGTSAFANLRIANTSGTGSSTLPQSVLFGAKASTTDTLTMLASTSAKFPAQATSTFQHISLQGTAGSPVYLRSSTNGARYAFYVPGTQKQVTYVDVKDSTACPTTIAAGITSTDSGNNLCWTFTVGSAASTTISGILYANEGVTAYAASTTINIAISTSTTPVVYSTSTNASGAWSFNVGELTTTARVTVWVNASTSVRAALFTKTTAATSTVTNLPLYKDRVIISHEGATTSTSTSNVDLSTYDSDNDTDIQFNATASTFNILSGQELYVFGGKKFSLSGSSTVTGNVHIATTSILANAGTTTIVGHFDNNAGVYSPGTGTTTFSSTTAQTISGALSGASALGTVTFTGAGTKTLANNASTTNLTINSGATVVAPTYLSISGNYNNAGTFTAGSGTTTFSAGATATGTMTGTSAFKNIEVSGGTATTTFNAPFTSTGHFKATDINASIAFTKNATTTLTTATIQGTSGNEIHLRSTTAGTRWGLAISGAYSISYVDVKDGNGSSTAGNITATSSIDSLNNNRWTFATEGGGPTITKPSVINATVVSALTAVGTSSISVPADTTYIVAFWSGYDAAHVALSTMRLNGTALTLHTNYTEIGNESSYAVGSMPWSSGSGNFNFTWTMSTAPDEGSPFVVAFIKDASTTAPYTNSAGGSWQDETTHSVSISSPTTNHLVLGVVQSYQPNANPDAAQDDQSILFSIDNTTVNNEAVDFVQENTTDTPTTNITGFGNYISIVGISIAPLVTYSASVSLSSAANQTFGYTQATTTMSTITITNTSGSSITAANDIRIRIASTSVNMKWDTTDTTATFGGTASGKVANPVTYENSSTTLVIPVSNDFGAGDTLTIDGLSFSQFSAINTATVGLSMFLGGASDAVSDDADDKTITISGLLTLANHTSGQTSDNLDSTTETNAPLYVFNLTSTGENTTVTGLTFDIFGANGITDADMSATALYRDNNNNRTYDAGDTAVGGTPTVTLTGETGTIVFGTSFTASSTTNYVLVSTVTNIRVTEGFSVILNTGDIIGAGVTTGLITITGTLTKVQHMKGGGGGSSGGSHAAIGGSAPAGDGTTTGGGSGGGSGSVDPDSGTPIGSEVGFLAPSSNGSPQGAWTSGANTYTSNGVYTTTASNGARHTYGNFGFAVPGTNAILGFEVKLEALGSTAAGTISVGLSWNGGSNLTSLKTTSTLGLTDAVFLLGSPSDTWGRSWTPAETVNGTFTIEIVGNTSANTISVDAIQTKVYHQASGGGGGGGGAL